MFFPQNLRIWTNVMLLNQIIWLPRLSWLGTHRALRLVLLEPPVRWCGWRGLVHKTARAASFAGCCCCQVVVAANWHAVGSRYERSWPIRWVVEGWGCRLFGIWAVGDDVSLDRFSRWWSRLTKVWLESTVFDSADSVISTNEAN
jgi:hypothetical protein